MSKKELLNHVKNMGYSGRYSIELINEFLNDHELIVVQNNNL